MAGSKRFPASRKKLGKARREGDTARSPLLNAAVLLTVGSAYIFTQRDAAAEVLASAQKIFEVAEDFQTNTMLVYVRESVGLILGFCAPLLLLLAVCAAIVELGQIGAVLSAAPLAFRLSRVNPVLGLLRLWGFTEGGTPFAPAAEASKLLVISLLAFTAGMSVVRPSVVECYGAEELAALCIGLGRRMIALLAVLLLLCGIAELTWARRRRTARLAMDIEELARELRESEGSAEARAFRRQIHQELLTQAVVEGVRRSRVLIVGRR